MSAFALGVLSIPVATAVIGDEVPVTASVAEGADSSGEAFGRAGTNPDANLAGTGAVFLLFGIGTVSVTHRRRWRTIRVDESTIDVREGATKPAHA